MKRSPTARTRTIWRLGLYVVLLGLLVLLITRSQESLRAAVEQIRHADRAWLGLAIVAMAASLPATALVYRVLSPQPLKFWRTVWVQTAGFCVNKLLPSGSGAAGVSFLYLRANKVKNVTAGALVVLNNLLGFAGHFVLFWLLIATEPSVLSDLKIGGITANPLIWVSLGGVVLVIVAAFLLVGHQLGRRLSTFFAQLKLVVLSPRRLGLGLLYSMLITLCYTVTLWASAHAVGAHISLSAAIIALSSSVLATSAIPSPGGIGAAELGAYAGLLAVGVSRHDALAAALLYRVCSFWLPLLVGSLALVSVTRRGLLAKPKTTR